MKKLISFIIAGMMAGQAIALPGQTLDQYCYEIYWKDKPHCVAPELTEIKAFCATIAVHEIKEICYVELEKDCFVYESWLKKCNETLKRRKNEN